MVNFNYIVYKTINLINNKIYIGVHKQSGLDFDGYLGSGKWFKRSIKYHGIINFKRVILKVFPEEYLAYDYESKIVNSQFINSSNTYNIKLGGKGGWSHCHSGVIRDKINTTNKLTGHYYASHLHTEEVITKSKLTRLIKYGNVMGKALYPENRRLAEDTKLLRYGSKLGKLHSPESRIKASRSNSITRSSNSDY